jgi:hypothetical protein
MTARTGGSMPAPPPAVAQESLQGRYAGFASRFAAFVVDRALHDVIAGTVVIYSWDARAARLRFLSRPRYSAPPISTAPPESPGLPGSPGYPTPGGSAGP